MLDVALPLLWIGGWILASVLYRRANDKPIIPHTPPQTDFHEGWCSGRSLGNWLTRIGGARNCLMVFVRDGELTVSPHFPFTLLFLPEIYGIELKVPVSSIVAVQPTRSFFMQSLRLDFGASGPAPLELRLRDEAGFARSLGKVVPGLEGSRSVVPRKGRKLTAVRVFLLIWGLFAITAAGAGLPDDWRYRHEGKQAVGVFVEPGAGDPRINKGVLVYKVGARTYRLSSLYGPGTYTVGETETVYYKPNNPSDARESGLLRFELMFAGLGVLVLALSAFGGRIARLLS